MKIVHLNTHSYGGAAIVARRLHLAARAAGHDSHLITRYGLRRDATEGYSPLHNAWLRYQLRALAAHRGLHKLGKLVQRYMQHPNLAHRPAGYEVFSPRNTERRFHDCADRFDPDVIHLHWVAGFVDHPRFIERNRGRRFVWTLHDMNPFTGGCHHADGCGGFTEGCRSCPQLEGTIDRGYAAQVFADKAELLSCLSDDQLVITAPSRWLLELSRQSPITGRFRHRHVLNPSATGSPAKPDAAAARRTLGLPAERKIVLFVSDNLRNPRKGIDLLFAAADRMRRKGEILWIGVGHRTDAPPGLDVRFTGRLIDEAVLSRYFASADVLVNPSLMENSPLTVIEALSCGTPVVVFGVGGAGELVDAASGFVLRERNADALAHTLDVVLFQRSFDRDYIQQRAEVHAPAAVIQQFEQIYRELLLV